MKVKYNNIQPIKYIDSSTTYIDIINNNHKKREKFYTFADILSTTFFWIAISVKNLNLRRKTLQYFSCNDKNSYTHRS